MIRLLLVEDDGNLAYIVKSSLEEIIEGYEVTTAGNGLEGLKAWKEIKPDIIISDVDMPIMNGFEMVKLIRETDKDTPILFASALTTPKDVTSGYKLGVNNYVKKPFVPEELDAHIHAILKLKNGEKLRDESNIFSLGNCKFDSNNDTLTRNGKTKSLTAREAGILAMLCKNKNNVVKRENILSEYWNTEDDFFASRSLDVFVTKLRKVLEDEPAVEIRTIRGVGLMLSINN
jgi:DNA-binding response OmpR family regulator